MTQTAATQPTTNPEPNNLTDALTELRQLRADLDRAAKPTRDLLAELADTRRTLIGVTQKRDRLDQIWRRMVTEAADVERALIRAGYERPTSRAAELITQLTDERNKLVETVGRMISLPPHLVAEAYGVTYTGSVKP
ncbi:hypothetical protein PSN13_06524 [Micromonospora saelicesensis]|uniref:Uncharacterized protein n=1 Tax=Micromonospora saelicesensis TaxID=285676 RepID=A0A328NC47_9ACTN|nr:hypothetical protein [Micromonospora saelicesensis]RAO26496.1 hypothetical protein PSN13_06524 [Micromonospora saelicesensis]